MIGHRPTTVDAAFVARFNDAIGAEAVGVPAMVLACRIFEAQNAARVALVPEAIQRGAVGGVHGEHDLVLHRSLVPGEPLRTSASLHGIRPAGRNTKVTIRYTTLDAGDAVVAEQWWTTVFLGVTGEPVGSPPPDHRFPDDARARPLSTAIVEVDTDMPRRYAEVSGDWSPHHFELDAAHASGADHPFLHGLCTMALCARAVAGDRQLRRIAVRFASTLPVGGQLEVAAFDAGVDVVVFEATSGGTPVITHGRAELADQR